MKESLSDDVRAVRIGSLQLDGLLGVPAGARGLVIFAHGSGSGRLSPRNGAVARGLRQSGCATLLLDLLLPHEEAERAKVFDVGLLAQRLGEAIAWGRAQDATRALPIGLFGASTGAGAALAAAAVQPDAVAAVVSRGGRPDLAGDALLQVLAPTLLIVGGRDTVVLELNRRALARLACEKDLAIVPGATHLFEEPGALERVLDLAAGWFGSHFAPAPAG